MIWEAAREPALEPARGTIVQVAGKFVVAEVDIAFQGRGSIAEYDRGDANLSGCSQEAHVRARRTVVGDKQAGWLQISHQASSQTQITPEPVPEHWEAESFVSNYSRFQKMAKRGGCGRNMCFGRQHDSALLFGGKLTRKVNNIKF
ncbi:hypothetical protein K678_09358 [Magnetospirillum fulvum MGU-K5]|uniref:Uncharacterized protein n=1 Tax=Magnetospirillum fulvum MGU-K5 TaxID=1316936 RepID=S9TT67_MAGFU|nr:hypothetical protein K678_09358 [Magnetospirillum fulvum MGU-K5]